jgi:outer membrane protein assembly factor BamE (lipoprotein component of BamABCDE complex)
MELAMTTMGRACLAVLAPLALGCTTAAQHQQQLGSTAEREMTLGIVQKEIRTGLTQGEVAAALGSPNIVTRDAAGNETWIYDKVATEASYSQSAAYGTILILGASSAAGAAATTQKTLTVVIKFDGAQRVETFSYHSSRF